jgi:thymidine kinase
MGPLDNPERRGSHFRDRIVSTLHASAFPTLDPNFGRIEIITGVMFSGKTDELMRRVRRAVIARRGVQLFKSHLDERYGGIEVVSSHDGHALKGVPVSSARQIAERMRSETSVVAVDEVQFLDEGIVPVASALADRGVRVILAGTDMDFRGQPFGPVPALMAVAEQVDKLTAVCVACGQAATRNQRLVDGQPAPADSPVLMVGGLESYEARCRACHEVPGVDHDQYRLEMPSDW